MLNETQKLILELLMQKKITPVQAKTLAATGGGTGFPGVAVIGMSGKFPMADSPEELWSILETGRSCEQNVPETRWTISSLKPEDRNFVSKGCFIRGAEEFDPLFFNISPAEAPLIDPRQRLFLMEAWKAFEDAGYSMNELSGKNCGVYVGVQQGDYIERLAGKTDACMAAGNNLSLIPSRISYFLNLKGPAAAIDCACSSSLVCVNMACDSIVAGECEMAVAGGINIMASPHMYISLGRAGMLSKSVGCHTFDEEADGIIIGESVNAVILKRLDRALSDGDHIYGVIEGYGSRQNGRSNGITAPNGAEQAKLIAGVYEKYGIHPGDITYVEAHGTGTKLGDPVEAEALIRAFRKFTNKSGYCRIGSIKPNIGHTLAAAGTSSLIKTLLCFRHRKIPGLGKLNRLNHLVPFDGSPFTINRRWEDWNPASGRRLAAISSFGMSGTNAHLVLGEYISKQPRRSPEKLPLYLIPLSAASAVSLKSRCGDLLAYLKVPGEKVEMTDLSYTLCHGRTHFNHRMIFIVKDAEELKARLAEVTGSFDKAPGPYSKIPAGHDEQPIGGLPALISLDAVKAGELLHRLADRYLKGAEIGWSALFAQSGCKRVSLPAYRFDLSRYWVGWDDCNAAGRQTAYKSLPHENVSDASGLAFHTYLDSLDSTRLWVPAKTGVPAVRISAMLEMAVNGAQAVSKRKACTLYGIRFAGRFTTDKTSVMKTRFKPQNGDVVFRTEAIGRDDGAVAAFSGSVGFSGGARGRLGVTEIMDRCRETPAADEQSSDCPMPGDYVESIHRGIFEQAALLDFTKAPAGISRLAACIDTAMTLSCLDTAQLNGATVAAKSFGKIVFDSEIPDKCIVYVKAGSGIDVTGGILYEFAAADMDGNVRVSCADMLVGPLQPSDCRESYRLMKKGWVPAEREESAVKEDAKYIVLLNGEKSAVSTAAMANSTFVCVTDSHAGASGGGHLFADFNDPEAMAKIAGQLVSAPEIEGVFDLSDLYSEPLESISVKYGRITFAQRLIQGRALNGSFTYIHLTNGMQAFKNTQPSLAGADFAGLVRSMGSEYRRLNGKTVDIDGALAASPEKMFIMLKAEAANGRDCEICYRDGKRYVPVAETVRRVSKTKAMLQIPPYRYDSEKVYFVTGGTGGIGSLLVRRIVRAGVKKLALAVHGSLPDRRDWEAVLVSSDVSKALTDKIKSIMLLEKSGIEVIIYDGSLSDEEKLSGFAAMLREKIGAIGGIFHCAGSIDMKNLAFINKNIMEFKRLYEPKVGAAQAIFRAFGTDTLDFLIFFSSVSAQQPLFASGMSSYAASNYFLDIFAAQQTIRGATACKSIVWPMWSTGMTSTLGLKEGPGYYSTIGYKIHTPQEGFMMLDDVLSSAPDCTMPAIVDDDIFDEKYVFTLKPPTPETMEKPEKEMETTIQKSGAAERIAKAVTQVLSRELNIDSEKIEPETKFAELGVDSIILTELIGKFEAELGMPFEPYLFFEFPNVRLLAEHIAGDSDSPDGTSDSLTPVEKKASETGFTPFASHTKLPEGVRVSSGETAADSSDGKIAIIGMACHFPGSESLAGYWQNLKDGLCSVREVPPSRWDASRLYSPVYCEGKSTGKWGGFIDGIESFDYAYFGISREDAPHISPLVRQSLEQCTNVIRDAGYQKEELGGKKVGVFFGTTPGTYPYRIKSFKRNTISGIGQNFVSAYASHIFDFKGPSLTVDCACASSLMSVHLACESIASGECEMAVAGGVDLLIDETQFMIFSMSKALAPDGVCKAFSESADGIVPGEGSGAVLLKRLDSALRDGDRVYAVIDSAVSNNDGHTMGITTPNMEAQSAVVKAAIEKAGIDPRSVSLIETHGTGTKIGDPIELKALTNIYRESTADKGFCAVGSVKTNIGHCFSAAGIASLIKTALCVSNRRLVPTLHCEKPNSRFRFDKSPFYINRDSVRWDGVDGVNRAGISAFGFGGTNVHMIISNDAPGLDGYCPRRKPSAPYAFDKKWAWVDKNGTINYESGTAGDREFELEFSEI